MNIFNSIRVKKPNYSTFSMSYDLKMSGKMGKLIPVHLQEALPGDTFHQSTEAMFRMMPLVAPIMHKVDIYFHHFFCPNRILWSNWEKFITGGQMGDVPPAFPTLRLPATGVTPSSLHNYLGLPVSETLQPDRSNVLVNAIPFAMYQRIWYEYYRDQNLQNESGQVLTDGEQSPANTQQLIRLHERAWEHDYFTAALPFAQKGPPVNLPIDLAGARVEGRPTDPLNNINQAQWKDSVTGATIPGNAGGGGPIHPNMTTDAGGGAKMTDSANNLNLSTYYDPNGQLYIDGVANSTINDLRSAYALQRWLEKAARSGTRYMEVLRSFFNQTPPDASLQRPEFLGGSKGTMAISEVLQTSATDQTLSPQGTMTGHGISVSGGKTTSYHCVEHGYMMTILSIVPRTSYYNGLPRHFNKKDKLDYYWSDFAFLGEQPVRNEEVYLSNDVNQNEGTWGYLPRYAEYRYNPSRVVGQMATTLEFWQMGRNFGALPPLNSDFIKCVPTKRVFAVTDPDEDEIIGHIMHRITASRQIPIDGTPGLI